MRRRPGNTADDRPDVASPHAAHGSSGDGIFGRWSAGPGGLPVYHHTWLPGQGAPVDERVPQDERDPALHLHAFGNRAMTAVACGRGSVRLFEASRGARWLQGKSALDPRLSGGLLHVVGGDILEATWRSDGSDSEPGRVMDIEFGPTWLCKRLKSDRLHLEQLLFMPDGEDAIVLSMSRLTWFGDRAATLRVGTYWGLSPEPLPLLVPGPVRRWLGRRVRWRFKQLAAGPGHGGGICGIVAEPQLKGRHPARRHAVGSHDHRVALLALDEHPVAAVCTDIGRYFGSGPVGAPGGLAALATHADGRPRPTPACLALATDVTVLPGRTTELASGFAVFPRSTAGPDESRSLAESDPVDRVLKQYHGRVPEAWERTVHTWSAKAPRLSLPDHPDASREMTWSGVQLAQAAIRDDYFEACRVTQGGNYLYLHGLDAAPRDLCQHAFAALHVDPDLAIDTLRTVCRLQRPDGRLAWDLSGYGVRDRIPLEPGDLDLWLLWAAAEVFLFTRDAAVLDEVHPYHPRDEGPTATVREHLRTALQHFELDVGVGSHGLPRLRWGDWNDEILLLVPTPWSVLRTARRGESVFSAALAVHALARYAELCTWLDDPQQAAQATELASGLKLALRDTFTGRWCTRAWVGNGVEVGRDSLYLEPQPWALLSGALDDRQAERLVAEIDERLRSPSPIGAAIHDQPVSGRSSAPGTLENGGVWYAISGPLVLALAERDREMALSEWRKGLLAGHASAYPERWFGTWSGPDSFNSFASNDPGGTWVGKVPILNLQVLAARDWPVMNAHAHGWPLAAGAWLAGLRTDARGYRFTPRWPERLLERGFSWSCEAWSLTWAPDEVSGHVRPAGQDVVRIELELPSGWNSADVQVVVDGQQVARHMAVGDKGVAFEVGARAGDIVSFSCRRPDSTGHSTNKQ